jgi:hypothetical protein
MSPDRPPPRIVPVYAVTGGRTEITGRDLPWEALVTTTEAGTRALARLRWEQAHIVNLCRAPMSVAEVATELSVPIVVARVLVSDLLGEGLVQVHQTLLTPGGQPTTEILERLIAGLRTAV